MNAPSSPRTTLDAGASRRSRFATAPILLALIALVGSAAYANSFSVPFQWDDGIAIVSNPRVRDLGAFVRLFEPDRSVAYLSFTLNRVLGGPGPESFHLVNLAIHVGAAFLVFALVRFVARAASPEVPALARHADAAAALAALLFVAHPIQTQAVTYVVQRLASLAAFFYLASAVVYTRVLQAEDARRRGGLIAAGVVLCLLAVLTKQNAVTLPAALLLLDCCFARGTGRERLGRLWPFFAVTAAAVLLILRPAGGVAYSARQFTQQAAVGGAAPWWSYFVTQLTVVVRYLGLIVLPVGQNLDHDAPVYTSLLRAPVLASAAVLAAVLVAPAILAWRARGRSGMSRVVLFAVGWFVLGLAVESSFIPIADVMMEHRLFLPMVGPALLGASGALWVADRFGAWKPTLTLAGAVILALAVATHERNAVWRDPMTLWSDVLSKSPDKARPYSAVAAELMARGDQAGGVRLLETASKLPAVTEEIWDGLAIAYRRMGRTADAERAFRTGFALHGNPVHGAHRMFGELLLEQGRLPEACVEFAAELEIDRLNRDALTNHASCLLMRGERAEAVQVWRTLLDEEPDDPPTLFNLGTALAQLGDVRGAEAAYRRFLTVAGSRYPAQRGAAEAWLAGARAGVR